MLAAVRVRAQMLAAILQPADGMVHLQGQPSERHLLPAQQSLVPEAPAHIRRDDPHRAVVEPKALAKPGLNGMRELRRGDEREIAQPQVAIGDDAASFHRKHAVPGGADFPRHLDRRGLGNLIHRAIFRECDEDIVAPLLVHQWSAGFQGGQHIA